MIVCERCGRESAGDDRFCAGCGAPLALQPCGNQDAAFARFDRSVELIGTAPPSPTKARVLSTVARFRALALDPGALDLARAALALAEQFELDDVRAQAHITIGTSRNTLGTGDGGIGDIEAGIAIAEAAGSPEAGRGYTNLAAILAVRGDPRVAEVAGMALRTAERFGSGPRRSSRRRMLPPSRTHRVGGTRRSES